MRRARFPSHTEFTRSRRERPSRKSLRQPAPARRPSLRNAGCVDARRRVETRRWATQSPSWVVGLTIALMEELTRFGERLFRWRSYVPLLFIPVVVVAIVESRLPGAGSSASHVWKALCVALALVG